jgi:glycosyltransferase involved in cell wall biosynthesis
MLSRDSEQLRPTTDERRAAQFETLKIAFLIPNLGIGGGNSVILAHARTAAAAGHEVTVAVTEGVPAGFDRSRIEGPRVVSLTQASDTEYDIVIASWWLDVLLLPRLVAGRHALFLQRMEDRIYRPSDPQRSLVRETFRVPLPGITIANGLRDQFELEYGRELAVVINGLDKSTFRPDGRKMAPAPDDGVRVLVEGPLGSWHKGVVPALRLARSIADETWLLTSTKVGPISGVDRVFSRLTPTDAAAVYRSCDVLLKLSLIEGLGLPGLEMFHCGGTVLAFDVPGVTEYAEQGRNALLAPASDFEHAGKRLSVLCTDRDLLDRVKSGALETAGDWPSETEAGERFLSALGSLIESHPPTDALALGELESLSDSAARRRPSALSGFRHRIGKNSLISSLRYSNELRRARAGRTSSVAR